MFRSFLSILLVLSTLSSVSQPCKDYIKKSFGGGDLETKHQRFGTVLTTRQMFYLRERSGKPHLAYYHADNQGFGQSAALNAGAEAASVDSVLIDFELRSGEVLHFEEDGSNSEVEGVSLRGVANTHYFFELSEEQLNMLAEDQIKEYRISMIKTVAKERSREKAEEREFERANSGETRQFMNGVKCFMEEL